MSVFNVVNKFRALTADKLNLRSANY